MSDSDDDSEVLDPQTKSSKKPNPVADDDDDDDAGDLFASSDEDEAPLSGTYSSISVKHALVRFGFDFRFTTSIIPLTCLLYYSEST